MATVEALWVGIPMGEAIGLFAGALTSTPTLVAGSPVGRAGDGAADAGASGVAAAIDGA